MMQRIYAIEGAGLVKIGRSFAPELRLSTMQTHSPVILTMLGYVKGDHVKERSLHKKFRAYRVHGEWFRNDGAVKDWIAKAFENWKPAAGYSATIFDASATAFPLRRHVVERSGRLEVAA
jgi:hypothetical protein